LFLILPN